MNGAGGEGTVWASVSGLNASTSVTVHLTYTANGPDLGTPLPSDPSAHFKGSADPARTPSVVYPNTGVMLPPNINRLEVHWRPKSAADTLFEIAFDSPTASIRTYLRCTQPTNGGCIYELDSSAYSFLAEANRGGAPFSLRVRSSDDEGTTFGESTPTMLTFAERNVEGGIYYFTTTLMSIMRFDFGGASGAPETYLGPESLPQGGCVGCHAISPDGRRLVASLNGIGDGALVYVKDIARPKPLTVGGSRSQPIQFASFNPAGDRFVAIYGDNGPPDSNKLFFHDGNTGGRLYAETVTLPFEPDHPNWSLDGNMIAVSHVGQHNASQRPFNCGIDLIRKGTSASWGDPETIVPIVPGKSRYNPNFSPDSKYLLYTESVCPDGDITSEECDGDADHSAKTWAVLASAGATPVRLAMAGSPGPEDKGATDLSDTFPRFSPIAEPQGEGTIHWVTISSRRRVGLRDPGDKQYLWMFAVDASKVTAGEDPSYAAFYLPFQSPDTSNHIAQWTREVIPVTGPN
jgi:hypothetical protein